LKSKVYLASTAAILSLLFLASAVLADEIGLSLTDKEVGATRGQTVEVTASITNNIVGSDRFHILITPSYWVTGISAEPEAERVTVPYGSSKVVKLFFKIPDCIESLIQDFNITVTSTTTSAAASQILKLQIIGGTSVCLEDITLDKYIYNPEETVVIKSKVKNVASDPSGLYYLETTIKNNGQLVQKFTDEISVPASSSLDVTNNYPLDRFIKPGIYVVKTTLKNILRVTLNSKETSFEVRATYNIQQSESTNYGFLIQTKTITVKNIGNTASSSFYVTTSVPGVLSVFTKPLGMHTVEQSYDRVLYHWLIPTLQPNEERIVEYQINTWNLWIVILIAGVAVVFLFNYVFTPKIIKRHTHYGRLTGEKEVKISIEVKNHSRHAIHDVTVTDIVPPIAKILNKFDTLRPEARKLPSGIQLMWKIKTLRPREERVLTYRIKPVVEIGGLLRLPRARINYFDKKKNVKSTASKSITIKAK